MNNKIIGSEAINIEEFLAHHGIKGQQWGRRRFQNEDGTLTEEGRRRYGLNPKYANMSDKEMRDILERKRIQNEYVQNITAGTRKKQQDIRSFTAEALNVAGQGVNVWDKTKLESDRKLAQNIIDSKIQRNKTLTEAMKNVDPNNPEYIKAKTEIEENKRIINEQKALKDEGIKAKKDAANLVVNTGKTYAPDLISKGATSKEIKEKTAEAQRNIEEMNAKQLKKVVERMRLEKQYDELINPPKLSKIERGREVLQTIGSLLGVTLTALTIAEVVKKLGEKGAISHTNLIESGGDFLIHYRTKESENGIYQHNQAGHTQKFAERQARIQNIYNRQLLHSKRIQEQENLRDQLNIHETYQIRRDELNRKIRETIARNTKINSKEFKKFTKDGKYIVSGIFSGSIKQLTVLKGG